MAESTPAADAADEANQTNRTDREGDAANSQHDDVFRVTDPILVRQPIHGDVDAVRSAITAIVGDDETATPAALLPDAGVHTCSVFLSSGDGPGPAAEPTLSWYLEVSRRAAGWASPAARILSVSPLFDDAAVRDAVAHGSAVVHSPAEAAVHARLPDRPGVPDPVEVVLVRVPFEPGLPSLAMRGIDRLVRALRGTWVADRMEAESREILEDERMWTETLWLVDGDGEDAGASLRWYMEAETMQGVMDAYEDSDNVLAGGSEWLTDRLFADPLSEWGDPADASDVELLAHLTDPARP